MAAGRTRRSFGKGQISEYLRGPAPRAGSLSLLLYIIREKNQEQIASEGAFHTKTSSTSRRERADRCRWQMKFLFENRRLTAILGKQEVFERLYRTPPVCSSGSGRKTQASAYSSEKRLCRFSGKQAVPERFCGTYACLLATGEKWTNDFFRLSVELPHPPRPSFRVPGDPQIHLPLKGKAFFSHSAQTLSDNEAAVMGERVMWEQRKASPRRGSCQRS